MLWMGHKADTTGRACWVLEAARADRVFREADLLVFSPRSLLVSNAAIVHLLAATARLSSPNAADGTNLWIVFRHDGW